MQKMRIAGEHRRLHREREPQNLMANQSIWTQVSLESLKETVFDVNLWHNPTHSSRPRGHTLPFSFLLSLLGKERGREGENMETYFLDMDQGAGELGKKRAAGTAAAETATATAQQHQDRGSSSGLASACLVCHEDSSKKRGRGSKTFHPTLKHCWRQHG